MEVEGWGERDGGGYPEFGAGEGETEGKGEGLECWE